ncbi:NYN domain-containing protein [Candidatus Babeliales bacterium]|nr:NYN domain-containing protein [Candidatus Babeliales bacterium]MBP9843644.1 NYN domain-containing protein [Candidatus Babeliales bacterium]
MIILIDAYNLFKTVLHAQFVQKAERVRFLNLFEKYATMRSHEIVLVFDGGSDVHELLHNYDLIKIYYSGYNQSADDLIKKKLKIYQGKDVLLVTSDRDIRQFAKQCSIESIGSQEFHKILQSVMNRKEQQEVVIAQTIHKTSSTDNAALDTLMELGSRRLVPKDQDKEVRFVMDDASKKYDSKKDKKLLKKIVKI